MDKIKKFLKNLNKKEKILILKLIEKIIKNNLSKVDTKKLRGHKDLYRVRKGKIRIIFIKEKDKNTLINIDYRKNIYNEPS
ncbi:MAG: type II toxin-antitoxin system RelE/ParE family toxin [Nitrospirota bacterium]